MSTAKPVLLLMNALPPEMRVRLDGVAEVVDATDATRRDHVIEEAGPRIEAVLTIGTIGLSSTAMDLMPSLRVVSCLGVGYEGVDLAAARARGIVESNGHGTNAIAVADPALALMLAIVRGIPQGDAAVRRGEWRASGAALPELTGMRLGVLGLGSIGLAVARRCELGFDMGVGYHSRSRRPESPYAYHADARSLAAASGVLVLAAPGGPETRHIVDREVLAALGPEGFLINVARGSLVDTATLVDALRDGGIAGAALDVVEGEPQVPADLLACPNLVITPHVGGRSPNAQRTMIDHAVSNFQAFFAGREVSTPVS